MTFAIYQLTKKTKITFQSGLGQLTPEQWYIFFKEFFLSLKQLRNICAQRTIYQLLMGENIVINYIQENSLRINIAKEVKLKSEVSKCRLHIGFLLEILTILGLVNLQLFY